MKKSPTDKIKCGVVGVGYLGQHHARIYKALSECELIGVYDLNTERAKEIALLYDCNVFDSPEALAKECHGISVAVPTDKHCETALKLLDQGCHLLIEKPLCVSLEEAEKILAKSKAKNCLIQVGHIEHFNPVMAFLEEKVQNPKFITADRLAPFNPRGTEVGVVLDLMIHDIGVILQLVKSPIKKIESVGVNVLSQHEDIANTRIEFESGCVANLNVSRVSSKKVREIRIFQKSSYLSLDFMNQQGHLLRKEKDELIKEDIPIQKGEPLMLELASFVECIKNASLPKVDVALGKNALELAIQITEQIVSQLKKS